MEQRAKESADDFTSKAKGEATPPFQPSDKTVPWTKVIGRKEREALKKKEKQAKQKEEPRRERQAPGKGRMVRKSARFSWLGNALKQTNFIIFLPRSLLKSSTLFCV